LLVRSPRFALTVDQLLQRVPGGSAISVSSRSSLVLDGCVELHSLALDGALEIRAGPGVRIIVRDCVVKNRGWEMRPLQEGESGVPAGIAIRGYVVERHEGVVVREDTPGEYELTQDGVLRRL